ncbi:DNA cytosine methyltransferase [Pseudoalteromonas sp. 1_2015MBL_MicDiv]|uniref:DNA cytosine methyltransferase n=1 Tax=Pseudoalteromonas sp. 1_2015MBL_MicDiv TaxID=1720343 RepID=UPI000BBEB4D7|nr:DNA cytosine methyltransferase [Pseudoalteromonas sp. 1_2015MBL_MicDiv]ATG77020.1 modification methylase SinI [Pseudoalteromonas sp. 1_2015MBL_MicDiv]
MSTEISIKDAAKQLNISEQRVRTLCRQNELKSHKFGTSWLIDKKSLSEYGLKTAHTVAEDHPAYNVENKRPIALSFFSGAMGLDLGIEKSGFDIRLACEIDKFCRQTIAINKPNSALLTDINNYSAKDIRKEAGLTEKDDIDLIMGGPPCQAFSTAGKRKGFNDDRGNVFLKYLDLCLDLKPKYFVIENVRGLLSCPMEHRPHEMRGEGFPELGEDELKGGALNYIINRLENSGYGYAFNLYNSANFGTPQVRERVIIVCSRDGQKPPYLMPTHSEDSAFGLPKWNVLKDCIGDIKKHDHLNFPEKRLKYYRILTNGQNWKNLPTNLQKEAMGKSYYSGGGKTGFLRRLAWEKPAPTLVTHPAMPATDLAHPEEDRPISVQEYKRIQEFPDNWLLAGPLVQQYKQVGNAVPIGLGFAVGNLIMNLIKGVGSIPIDGFKYSRYKKTSDTEWKAEFLIRKEKLKSTQINKQAV